MEARSDPDPGSDASTPNRSVGSIGCLGLIGLAILDFVTIGIGGQGYCGTAPAWTYVVLLLVPVVAGAGGLSGLVFAARSGGLSAESRKGLRRLGIVAVIFMILSGLGNLVATFLWNFCLP